MEVEHIGYQGTLKSGQGAFQDIKSGTGDFNTPLKVNTLECFTQFPMGTGCEGKAGFFSMF